MKLLVNDGLIDIDVIKTMGVNIKDSDSSIGYFGTGLKYAIAVFLRNDIDLIMYRGTDKYYFSTERKVIREKEFHICVMSGPHDSVELGFTTELGKNWDVWQAYRELHSNCLDEHGKITDVESESKVFFHPDTTSFLIDYEIDHSAIFLVNKNVVHSDGDIEILNGESEWIFYKGIRAKKLNQKSLYTYNILRDCNLTEDRLLSYDWQIKETIAHAVAKCNDKQLIQNTVSASNSYEKKLEYCGYSAPKPSDEFIEVCSSSKGVNNQHSEYILKNTPSKPKTYLERQAEFILALNELCAQFDVSTQDNETSPITYTLHGGILLPE